MRPDGFVLAGGASRRMGVDKARIPFPERWPMAVHVLGRLRPVCDRVALVRGDAPDPLPWGDPEGRPVELIRDRGGDRHPLSGIAAALEAATTELVLIVPCDLPWLTSETLQRLVDVGAPAVAHDGERVQPLVGVFPRSDAPRAARAASEGRSAREFVSDRVTVPIQPRELRNVNTWAETGRPGLIRTLLANLPWLRTDAQELVVRGEIARLAARGVVDPGAPGAAERIDGTTR